MGVPRCTEPPGAPRGGMTAGDELGHCQGGDKQVTTLGKPILDSAGRPELGVLYSSHPDDRYTTVTLP